MHYSYVIAELYKLVIIEFYNETKAGIDALDKKCETYSTQRRIQQWPMAIFNAFLDITGVNSFVLYTIKNGNSAIKRRDFLITLGKSLIDKHIKRWLNES